MIDWSSPGLFLFVDGVVNEVWSFKFAVDVWLFCYENMIGTSASIPEAVFLAFRVVWYAKTRVFRPPSPPLRKASKCFGI